MALPSEPSCVERTQQEVLCTQLECRPFEVLIFASVDLTDIETGRGCGVTTEDRPVIPPSPENVQRDGTSAQFNPQVPADQQLREWGWDPNRLNPSQLEVMARRYAHSDKPLLPHVDALGRPLSADGLGVDDVANAWLHANPDINGATKFLPLVGDEQTRSLITAKDQLLQKVNAETLGVRPKDLGYRVATLNGTAPDVSDMRSAADTFKAAVDKAIAVHGKARELYSGEYASECVTKIGKARLPGLDEHVKSLSSDAAKAHKAVVDTGVGAQAAFQGFHDAVDGYREDIARLAVVDGYGQAPPGSALALGQAIAGKTQGEFCAADPKVGVAAGAKQAAAAGDEIGKLFAAPSDDHTPVELGPAPLHAHESRHGAPGGPGGLRSGFGGGHPGPVASPPTMPAMPPLGGSGIPAMPQMPPMAAVPPSPTFGEGAPHTGLAADHHGGDASPDSLDANAGDDRRTSPESRAADAALVSPPLLRPGDPVRKGQLGADMKPLDKDGDGRMDADAVAPTQHNMDPHHHGKPDNVATAVIVGGVPHAVSVDDPRLLEMMNTLGTATPGNPVDVLDAAARAGAPLSGYGHFIDDPMDAKTGDVMTGSKGTGMYMGGGQVLMADGSGVKPLIDVFEFRPPHSGFFRLDLPALPVGDDAGTSIAVSTPAATQHEQQASPPPAAAPPPPAAEVPAPAPAPPPTSAQPIHQSAPVEPSDVGLPFPAITTETAPRSW